MSSRRKEMTRKDFLKTSGAGLAGLIAPKVFKSQASDPTGRGIRSLPARALGRTGIRTPALGFGASRTMEPSLLAAALDRGMTFIDTGRSYFNGNNERMVGEVVKGIRKDVIIQSKMRVNVRRGASAAETAPALRREMESAFAASLKALQTDYIDLMLIHDAGLPEVLKNETVMEFFAAAKKSGRIRAHGFSCHDEIDILQAANESGFWDVIMTPFNHKGPYVHMISKSSREWDQPRVIAELEKAHANNLGVVVMKTCSGGPYAPPGTDRPTYSAAIRWVLDHPFVGVAAVAMADTEEMAEDVKAL
jgi:aryl-alcohol dehydrogenase-like predicted oxidoreductase